VDWYQEELPGTVSQDKAREFLEEVKKAPKESHPSLPGPGHGLPVCDRTPGRLEPGAGGDLATFGGLCPG